MPASGVGCAQETFLTPSVLAQGVADILHRVQIQAAPEQVYAALTEGEKLSEWWTRGSVSSPDVDAVAEFPFQNGGASPVVTRMRIQHLNPNKEVRWTCVRGPDEWTGTRVSFRLEQKDDATIVHFAHRGWKETSDSYEHWSTKWGYFLLSLKQFLETGKGTPHPEDLLI
jgi:uncharacterized protein YndB with AHSA1/START domain